MKAFFLTILAISSFVTVWAQDADRVMLLEQKVQKLEERLGLIENYVASAQQTPEAKKMMRIAREQIELQEKNFRPEEIAKVEALYQKGAQLYSKEDSRKFLDSLVSAYPQYNRAGCAQLFRAQQECGEEQERLLKDCIERFSTCYYFGGAQVGPLAMLYLGQHYRQMGRNRDARKLFRRLRNKSREAVGHGGELLVSRIDY